MRPNDYELMGIDIGGTFTDLVHFKDGDVNRVKTPTTPDHMRIGVENAIEKAVDDLEDVDFLFHGTTSVINALLERDGAKTGLLVTDGFRDVYELGRGSRPEPFNVLFEARTPYVPRRRRLEVGERIDGSGDVVTSLNRDDVLRGVREFRDQDVESIAVCFLNSYVNPAHENEVADIIADEWPDVSLTLSSALVREWKEYERVSTAAMNAYVKPMMESYIEDLETLLASLSFSGNLLFLQSTGGAMSSEIAAVQPLAMVESGPAGGIIGSAQLSEYLSQPSVIGFDMGGTTAKAGLIEDATVSMTRPYYIGGHELEGSPSLLPAVDIKEIGAGGGSIAYVDRAGGLKVGPQSAGANPGPACYGNGGEEPTITDAHVILGRISSDNFLGGEIDIDVDAARNAVEEHVADPLGLTIDEAAEGILNIANNQMALMLREESVQKGSDPRELSIIAYGGAGPLHAADIARQISARRIIVPNQAANFSAFGTLMSNVRHEFIQTVSDTFEAEKVATIQAIFEELQTEGENVMENEGQDEQSYVIERYLELYYDGQSQSHTLSIDVDGELDVEKLRRIQDDFHRKHEQIYGYAAPDNPIRTQNVGLTVRGKLPTPEMGQRIEHPGSTSVDQRTVVFDGERLKTDVYSRGGLEVDSYISGPAIVEEPTTTVLVGPNDRLKANSSGALEIEVGDR